VPNRQIPWYFGALLLCVEDLETFERTGGDFSGGAHAPMPEDAADDDDVDE